jgi:prepilin-type N-terminal cleavage/methylation domain-containing protein
MNKTITQGFTLIELLVAIAVISVVSVASTQILSDTLTSRAKQYSITESSDDMRRIISDISASVKEAKSISIPNGNTLEITADICKTFKLNTSSSRLEVASDANASCTPPTSGFSEVNAPGMEFSKFDFSPVTSLPAFVNLEIEGINKDPYSQHPFVFKTTLYPRVGL